MFLEENPDEIEFQDMLEIENQNVESDTDSDGDNNMGPSEEQNYSSIIEKKILLKRYWKKNYIYLLKINKVQRRKMNKLKCHYEDW